MAFGKNGWKDRRMSAAVGGWNRAPRSSRRGIRGEEMEN